MRLIDADDLEKRLHERALDEWNQRTATTWSDAFLECEDMVYDAPTVDAVPLEDYRSMERTVNKLTKAIADAEPVRHGHWIEHEVGLICSECGHYTEAMYDEPFNNEFGRGWALKRPYYCGYCGAKMDEVEDGKAD